MKPTGWTFLALGFVLSIGVPATGMGLIIAGAIFVATAELKGKR